MKQRYIIAAQLVYRVVRVKLYFLAIIMFLVSCGVKRSKDKIPNGNKKRVFYYLSGEKRHSYSYFLKGLDTVKVDHEMFYFKENKIKEIIYYSHKGDKDSSQTFYKNGNKESFLEYRNNLKHGKNVNRFPSGNIEYITNHKKGLLDGESKGYYDTQSNGLRLSHYFKEGKRYLHQYEYDSTGNLKTYIFTDPITSEVTYSAFYEKGTFLFGNGLKKPIIVSKNTTLGNKIKKNSLFSCEIITISPPLTDSKLYYKIEGLNDTWVLIEKENEYEPYKIKHPLEKDGFYRLQLKFVLKYPKTGELFERINSLDIIVVN